MLTERAAGGVGVLLTNLCAALGGAAGAWAVGFGWWSILVAPLTGTAGWLLGWFAGRRVARALASGGYAPAGLPVYRLRSLPPDETTAGGKARSLSRLIRAGHRVPEGLVILPRGFDGEEPTPQAWAALRAELRRFPDGGRFTVRSSALSEDSAAASFAGAYESELDVSAADLGAAIARVRASAGSERVAAYAEGVQVASGGLAVVVQAMVPADLAGVLFTVHPLTRALDTMLGTVVTGLGEGLVSGERTGDQFTLHRPDGGYEGPEELAPTAARLHDEAHRIEGTFGGVPQDIEWAVASGRLWILQSRPISTLNPWQERTAERNDSLAGTCLWSATNLSEANPEAQTPLTVSFTAYLQAHGGPSMALRGREMAGSIGGRPYANLSVQVTGRRGKAAKLEPREAYRAMAGWWGDLPEGVPLPLIPMTNADWSDAGLPLLGTLAKMALERRGLPGFVRRNPDVCAELTAAIEACSIASWRSPPAAPTWPCCVPGSRRRSTPC